MGKLLISTPLKWLARSALTTIALALAAIIYLLVAVDPNDYKPQIKNLAANQGLELSLDGDIAWQFFPQIGIRIEQVDFALANSASGNIGQLTLAVNWSELLKLLNTSQTSNQLPMGSIKIADSSIRLKPLSPGKLPVELDSVDAVMRNISLQGESFTLAFSAIAAGGLKLSLAADMAIHVAGKRLQRFSLENAAINLDMLQLQGNLVTEDGFISAEGNLQGDNLNLKQQLERLEQTLSVLQLPPIELQAMADEKALTAIDFDITFSINSNAISTITTSLNIDGQQLMLDTQVNHPANNLYLGISGDSFKIANYMAADRASAQSQGKAQNQNSVLLAPLAAPLALWSGRSQLELSLGALDFGEFVTENIYLNLFGNQNVLRLSSLNADLFNGQINATGRLDMRSAKPQFELQPSLSNIDLQLALTALADNSDISGQLNLNADLQGAGNSSEELLPALSGSGELTVANPIYLAINVEAMFCNAAALLGGSAKPSSWSQGTQFENLSGQFKVANGKVLIEELKTTTGNLSINGRGTLQLLLKRFSINANTRVNGTTTSSSGCSVNKSLRNRDLPFICTGSFAADGKTSCKPDDNLLRGLLQNNIFQRLGEQSQEKDPIKGLLRGVLEKNFK